MSQYINFFIRSNNDEFLPIGSYSRNSEIYQLMGYAPYEKIAPVTKSILSEVIRSCIDKSNAQQKVITQLKEKIPVIATMNNTIEEKCDALADIDAEIKDCEEIISDYRYARHFFIFLDDVISDVDYMDKYNADEYIYCGIECGDVTLDDVVKK